MNIGIIRAIGYCFLLVGFSLLLIVLAIGVHNDPEGMTRILIMTNTPQ